MTFHGPVETVTRNGYLKGLPETVTRNGFGTLAKPFPVPTRNTRSRAPLAAPGRRRALPLSRAAKIGERITAGQGGAGAVCETLTETVTETLTETVTETLTDTVTEPRGRARELEITFPSGCCRWVGVWGREATPSGGQAAAPGARLTARPHEKSRHTSQVQFPIGHRPQSRPRALVAHAHADRWATLSARTPGNEPTFALRAPGGAKGDLPCGKAATGRQRAIQAPATAVAISHKEAR